MVVGEKPQITLRSLHGDYAICRLPAESPIPAWADGEGLVSITRTADELSVLCLESRVPANVRSEVGWRCLQFVGPFAFDQTGIAAAVLQPLADAGIGILLVSSFDTDMLFVKLVDAGRASEVLLAAGHLVAAAD